MKIKINDGGKVTSYTLKPFEAITIADWRKVGEMDALTEETDHRDALIAVVRALTGIPAAKLRRVPIAEFNKMLDLAGDTIAKVQAAREDRMPPASFTVGGVEYHVPPDIESSATYGQYEDLEKALMPQAKTEADLMAATCAVLCLPDGEEYDGEKALERMRIFDAMPIATALRINAFFFESSSAFRTVMGRCISLYLTSKLPKRELQPTP